MKHFLLLLVALCPTLARAQMAAQHSDQWTATDALGRSVGRYPAPQNGSKQVYIFYWTWHEMAAPEGSQVKNNTEIIRRHPEAMKDARHPAWKEKATGNYHWGEPLLGYYRTTDTWVLRKHAELLADAGVDGVFFDCTNGTFTWDESTDSLLATWDRAQRDGVRVPRIAFMLPFGPSAHSLHSLHHLYHRLYSQNRYPNLWLMWQGKPVIMAYPQNLTDSDEDQQIRQFFTFRPGQPDYVDGPNPAFPHQWGWLENYPQNPYGKMPDGRPELVTVGVAQNASPETNGHCSAFNVPQSHGRSFSRRQGFDPRPDGYLYGWNFAEQWDRAYELDPHAVFVTGWNEWIAGQFEAGNGPWTGKPFSFVDQFDSDHSRDIEPVKTWGDCGDVYYLQLVDRVRRFKGTAPLVEPSQPQNFRPSRWNDWQQVLPLYAAYRGNTRHRNAKACGQYHYVNTSGRNDIVGARVAHDEAYLHFYVETAEPLTSPTDSAWMRLLIDIDRSKATGWQGYDYIVNYRQPQGSKAYVQRSHQHKWIWHDCGTARLRRSGHRLVLSIPRAALGLDKGEKANLEFKWSDNMQDEGNAMDFYVNGDAAPGGRFNYIYTQP